MDCIGSDNCGYLFLTFYHADNRLLNPILATLTWIPHLLIGPCGRNSYPVVTDDDKSDALYQ